MQPHVGCLVPKLQLGNAVLEAQLRRTAFSAPHPLSRTPVENPCRDPLSRRTKGSGAESRSGASGVSVPKLELGNELPPNTMRKQKLECFQTGFVLFYPTNDAIHIHFSKSALANWRCAVGRKNLRSLCSQTKARFGCECLARMRKCQQSH